MHHFLAATQTATPLPPPPTLQRLQAEAGGGGQQYVGVLWQFLRMRQACNHPLLVKGASHGHELVAAEVRGVWWERRVVWQLAMWTAAVSTLGRL